MRYDSRVSFRDLPNCPTCNHTRWWEYKHCPDAPVAACGKCNHLVPVAEAGWGHYNTQLHRAASDLPADRRDKVTL